MGGTETEYENAQQAYLDETIDQNSRGVEGWIR